MESIIGYSGLTTTRTPAGAEIRAVVKNTSTRDGDEVAQLYVGGGAGEGAPIRSRRGFQRVHLKAGERRDVAFTLAAEDLPPPGTGISVGGGQPLPGVACATGTL